MTKFNSKNFNLLFPHNEQRMLNLGLLRIQKALTKLGNPCLHIPAVQIIGTNGKGSIAAFLESILSVSNINIGVTTSPHIFHLSERIRVNKKKISSGELDNLLCETQNHIKEFELSPFEIIICCGLIYFDFKNVELLLLEAGMGGRLDATTAHNLRPFIAIGNIGIDHKEFLGETIEEIAKEKVSVITKDSYVVSCKQKFAVERIINEKIQKVGAKIKWVEPLSDEWELGLRGNFQKQNAAVALGIIKILNKNGWHINRKDIKKGLTSAEWPGRLETCYWNNKEILIDSAHNPSAAKALANERKNWKNQEKGVYWILGVQKRKDIESIIREILEPRDIILLVPIQKHPSWSLKEILDIKNLKIQNIIAFKNLKEALKYLEKQESWPRCNPVVIGSIFLISEFKNIKY